MADAEAFDEVLFAVERLGAFLLGRIEGLAGYREVLQEHAGKSALAAASDVPNPSTTSRFDTLFELVRCARNDAMHQGAAARHLTRHCVELALILEDAIVAGQHRVGDFMTASPIEAKLFEPVGAIRRTMLMNSFSFLPVRTDQGWTLVSDVMLAQFLRLSSTSSDRKRRLGMSLQEAIDSQAFKLVASQRHCSSTTAVADLMDGLDELPVLVLRDGEPDGELLGLVTAFDLL